MQFRIPQDVQRADTIIGPITFKQLAIVLVGGGFAYTVYIILAQTYIWTVWGPPVAIIGLATFAVGFLKIKDMTFLEAGLYFIEYTLKPRVRYWRQGEDDVRLSIFKPLPHESKLDAKKEAELTNVERRKKLIELSGKVDRINTPNS